MEIKSLGTLNTRRLKLTPFPLHPKAILYFIHPVRFTLSLKRGGEGRGGPLETSELLRKWIFGYICVFDMFPVLKEGFNNCPKDVWPPLYFFSAEYSYFEISGKINLL